MDTSRKSYAPGASGRAQQDEGSGDSTPFNAPEPRMMEPSEQDAQDGLDGAASPPSAYGSASPSAYDVRTSSPIIPEGSGGPEEFAPGPPVPARQVSFSLGHFLKWSLALAGVFFAVLGLELLASFILVLTVEPLDALTGGRWYEFLLTTDGVLFQSLFIQTVWLVVAVPWWHHVRRRGIGLSRRPRAPDGPVSSDSSQSDGSRRLEKALAVVLMGIGLQIVISIILTLVLPLFPEVQESYDSMMDDSGSSTFSLLSVLSVAIAAPVVEETTFRGVAFQFALRAVCPAWRKDLPREGYDHLTLSTGQFWAANILQAAVFGIMHLNITQALYAFAIGLVCGWVFWRTGKLRWSMELHAVLNFASYFVNELLDLFGLYGLISPFGEIVVPIVLTVWGICMFRRATEDVALG